MLSLQNSDLPKGQISDGIVTADILTNDQISHAADYKPLIVGYNNGAAVRLSDVAEVTDSVQNVRAAGYLNGKRAVMLIIFRQPGANIIADRRCASTRSCRRSRRRFRPASTPRWCWIAPRPSAPRCTMSSGR